MKSFQQPTLCLFSIAPTMAKKRDQRERAVEQVPWSPTAKTPAPKTPAPKRSNLSRTPLIALASPNAPRRLAFLAANNPGPVRRSALSDQNYLNFLRDPWNSTELEKVFAA